MAEQPEQLWVECQQCRRQNRHEVIAERKTSQSSPDDSIHVSQTSRIIRCRGCEDVSFQRLYRNSEDIDPQTLEPEVQETLYPNRTGGRQPLDAARYFPHKVWRMYGETLKAFNVSAPTLAAVGRRAVSRSHRARSS